MALETIEDAAQVVVSTDDPKGPVWPLPEGNGGYFCSTCHKRWGGRRSDHCKVCHETFTGTTAGDKHRTGKHEVFEGPERRRCRSAAEMIEVGLELKKTGLWGMAGTWRGPGE